MKGLRIICIRMSDKLLEVIDKATKPLGFDSRSELVRIAVVTYLRQNSVFLPPEVKNQVKNLGVEYD